MRSIEVRADLPNLERATAYDVNMIHQARFLRNFLIIISFHGFERLRAVASRLASPTAAITAAAASEFRHARFFRDACLRPMS